MIQLPNGDWADPSVITSIALWNRGNRGFELVVTVGEVWACRWYTDPLEGATERDRLAKLVNEARSCAKATERRREGETA